VTSPLHARDVRGKGRYYGPCQDGCPLGVDIDPDRLYMSVTNAQSVVAKPALVPAAVKVTAAAAWDQLPRMIATSRQPDVGIPADGGPKPCSQRTVATRCGECRFCVTSAIKNQHRNEWETKADLGSAVHYHAAARLLGQPLPPDEQVEPFIRQYAMFLRAMGVDVDRDVYSVETTVFDRDLMFAGTLDVAVELPVDPLSGKITRARRLWLIDIKTSLTKPADTVYADQPLQLAGLRYAPRTVLVDDTEQETPEYAGAAILNLRTDDHAMIPLPADEHVNQAFRHAVELQRWFHDRADVKAWEKIDTHPVPEPAATTS